MIKDGGRGFGMHVLFVLCLSSIKGMNKAGRASWELLLTVSHADKVNSRGSVHRTLGSCVVIQRAAGMLRGAVSFNDMQPWQD